MEKNKIFKEIESDSWYNKMRFLTSINLMNLGKTGFLLIATSGTLGQTSGTTTVAGSVWVMGPKSSSGRAADPSSWPFPELPGSELKALLAVKRSCRRLSCRL